MPSWWEGEAPTEPSVLRSLQERSCTRHDPPACIAGARVAYFSRCSHVGAIGFDGEVAFAAARRGPRLATLNIREPNIKANDELALAA